MVLEVSESSGKTVGKCSTNVHQKRSGVSRAMTNKQFFFLVYCMFKRRLITFQISKKKTDWDEPSRVSRDLWNSGLWHWGVMHFGPGHYPPLPECLQSWIGAFYLPVKSTHCRNGRTPPRKENRVNTLMVSRRTGKRGCTLGAQLLSFEGLGH